MSTHRCSQCGRPLRSPASIARGMGKHCASKATPATPATPDTAATATPAGSQALPVTTPPVDRAPLVEHRTRAVGNEAEHRKRIARSMVVLGERQILFPWGEPPATPVRKKGRKP